MSEIFRLCRRQHDMQELFVLSGLLALALITSLVIMNQMSANINLLTIVLVTIIAAVVVLCVYLLYRSARVKATAAVLAEMKKIVDTQLNRANKRARVKEVLLCEEEENKYDVILTEEIDVSGNKELLVKLLCLQNNVSRALERGVTIYCNGIWIC